ncbi:MAG TPA: hypothetical protein VNH44_16910 [Micropepsaceae bacterium]|nr:hypothetical protein [Micropepsaceae bacterium]
MPEPLRRKEILGMIVVVVLTVLAYGLLMVVTEWDSTACKVLHSFFGWCR